MRKPNKSAKTIPYPRDEVIRVYKEKGRGPARSAGKYDGLFVSETGEYLQSCINCASERVNRLLRPSLDFASGVSLSFGDLRGEKYDCLTVVELDTDYKDSPDENFYAPAIPLECQNAESWEPATIKSSLSGKELSVYAIEGLDGIQYIALPAAYIHPDKISRIAEEGARVGFMTSGINVCDEKSNLLAPKFDMPVFFVDSDILKAYYKQGYVASPTEWINKGLVWNDGIFENEFGKPLFEKKEAVEEGFNSDSFMPHS